MPRAKRKTELRLVLRQEDQHALAWQATVLGEDVYAGPPATERGEALRLSYHQSGKTHFHHEGLRWPAGGPSPRARDVRGVEPVAAWSVGPVEWGRYRPKPNGPRRSTLIVDVAEVPIPFSSWTVQLVAVEPGRPELIGPTLADYAERHLLIGHISAQFEHGTLLMILWTIPPDEWNAIVAQIKSSEPSERSQPEVSGDTKG